LVFAPTPAQRCLTNRRFRKQKAPRTCKAPSFWFQIPVWLVPQGMSHAQQLADARQQGAEDGGSTVPVLRLTPRV
jgi:hypothetical protein